MKRVAIVNQVGFDRGGATTVCAEYAKIGIDVLFNIEKPLDSSLLSMYSNVKNIYTYSSSSELLGLVSKYDRLLFFNLWYGKVIPDDVFAPIISIKQTYPNIELCYMTCFRKIDDIKNLLPICNSNNFMFDHIFSLNPEVTTVQGWCKATIMNMNAVTLPEYNPLSVEQRKKIVFSSGRTEAFKNTTRYIQSIDDDFLNSAGEFTYIHEGAGFNFNKNGGVSCQPQLLSIFNLTSPKTLKSQYSVKRYEDLPDAHKFNLYPSYNVSDIYERWKYYYAGVCCILGTISGYSSSGFLFDTDLEITDSRERTLTLSKAKNWNDDLEYADIEKMIMGVPVFFSRLYASIIGFDDDRLIYNSFSDIPKKVNELYRYYDEVREGQYNWLVSKVKTVNKTILENFAEEFN